MSKLPNSSTARSSVRLSGRAVPDRLMSWGFGGLLATQLFGAANDNIFRWLVIGVGKQYVDGNPASVLMAGTVCFVVPYLFLAATAGYVADRFSKRYVIISCKIAEVMIMALGIVAIVAGSLWGLFAVVFLMGAQSALFSPAKSGSIPEMLPVEKISAANGLFGLTTVVATVIGAVVGNLLSDWTAPYGQHAWWRSALVLMGVAIAGSICSFFIPRLPVANPDRRFPWDVVRQTSRDLKRLASNLPLLRVALGIAFFWSLGTLANLNVDQFAFEGGASRQTHVVPLLLSLVVGVGLGSVLAGFLSEGRIELGILPLGAGGVVVSSTLLFTVQGTLIDVNSQVTLSFVWSCFLLFALGCSAGLFNVPLEAYMQHRSPRATRGSILAAGNFLTFLGILLSSVAYWALRHPWSPGSVDNVRVVAEAELDGDARQHIARIETEFQQQWQPPGRIELEPFLDSSGEQQRQVLLARLLWIEMTSQMDRNESVDRQNYHSRFPHDRDLVSDVYDEAMGRPLCTTQHVFLLSGILAIPVCIYIVFLIPQTFVRFVVWLAAHTIYRIRVFGLNQLPESGGALLVANHVSWIDGILLLLVSSRPIRMLVFAGTFRNRWWLWLGEKWGAIFISTGPKSIARALATARTALDEGQLVCIFPEGGITRSGHVQSFRPGMMKVLQGTDVPSIPVYLDELWGSIFSFQGGKFFWKVPKQWRYPVSIHFGQPIQPVRDVHQVRQAVLNLGAEAVQQRKHRFNSLPRAVIRMCKKRRFKSKAADSSGVDLTGGQLLMRSLILRRLLLRHVLGSDEQYVGVFLPPSTGGLIANLALTLDQRIAVNLNYTASSEILNQCIAQAGVKHILTSRRFIDNLRKLNDKEDYSFHAESVYLEDFRSKVTLADKLAGAMAAYVTPTSLLHRLLHLDDVNSDDVMTVIFTSGSTGTPKGVLLTYANIASNVEAIDQVVHLHSRDVVMGILPFFHSFGYTVTIWTAMSLDVKGIYHFNPLEARQIGKLARQHGATIMLATPTFLRNYLRRCKPEEFATLEVVVAGAEKLPGPLADAFEEKFGVCPVEGFGTTELSPIVSVNVPPSRSRDNFQPDFKPGTVGRTVPGVSAKIVDLDTGEELGANRTGMLLITGPNVMKGYLGQPETTAQVMRDQWYVTGDIAMIDDEGFISITGRESRFSKIGGEMVPHIQIEEKLNELLGLGEEDGLLAAVTAVPDPKKGERLVVIHKAMTKLPDELRKGLTRAGLPNIFVPSSNSFYQVDELPLLGTGKLDLNGIKQIAMEQFASDR